jgi:hypothetical protein
MENSSEKPKRGRPPVLDAAMEAAGLDAGFLDPRQTRRTHLNALYMHRALQSMLKYEEIRGEDPRLRWYYERRETGVRIRRKALLAELGRLDDPELIVEMALDFCGRPTRRAIAEVRQYRLDRGPGEGSPADGAVLAGQLRRVIEEYIAGHEDMTRWDIDAALEQLDEWLRRRHPFRYPHGRRDRTGD